MSEKKECNAVGIKSIREKTGNEENSSPNTYCSLENWNDLWFVRGLDINKNNSTCFDLECDNKKQEIGRDMDYNTRYVRHKFSDGILSQVSQYVNSNNYNGVLQIFEDWLVVFTSILVSCVSYHKNFIISLFVYVISLIIIGARQRSIVIKLHAAAHGALAKSYALNIFLGTICSGYSMFQSFSLYHKTHVQEHHPWIGNPYRDPDYQGFITFKICGKHRSSFRTKQYLKNIFSISNSIVYIKFLIYNRIYNKNEKLFECWMRIIYWIVILLILYKYQLTVVFLLFWIVPLLTTHLWIGSFLELCEHFPMIDISNEYLQYKDIYLTKNRIADPLTNFILGIHYEGYDLVHHLFPKIPTWNYVAVHNILMKDKTYKNLDHGMKGWVHIANQIIQLSNLDKPLNI